MVYLFRHILQLKFTPAASDATRLNVVTVTSHRSRHRFHLSQSHSISRVVSALGSIWTQASAVVTHSCSDDRRRTWMLRSGHWSRLLTGAFSLPTQRDHRVASTMWTGHEL